VDAFAFEFLEMVMIASMPRRARDPIEPATIETRSVRVSRFWASVALRYSGNTHQSSSPVEAGDPGRRGFLAQALMSLEY
jgi:hypothetical protein